MNCSSSSNNVCFLQTIDSSTPKKEREDALRNQKESMTIQQKEQEQVLDKQQKESLEYEIRKFRRRRYLQHHELEQTLLREVSTQYIGLDEQNF